MLLAVVVAVPMGVVAALRRNRAPDLLLSAVSALGISLPVYVTGLLLVLFFGLSCAGCRRRATSNFRTIRWRSIRA